MHTTFAHNNPATEHNEKKIGASLNYGDTLAHRGYGGATRAHAIATSFQTQQFSKVSSSVHGGYDNSASVEKARGPLGASAGVINQTCSVNLAGSKRMREFFPVVCPTGKQGAHTGA
jgi:hypothetical protein